MEPDRRTPPTLWSTWRNLLGIVAIVFIADVALTILLRLAFTQGVPFRVSGLLDAFLLSLITGAVIWQFVFRPLRAFVLTEQAKFLAFVDAAPDGIITFDGQRHVQSFNRAAARMFGYDPAEIIGQKISTLMNAPQLQPGDAVSEATSVWVHGAPEAGHPLEVRGRRKDGSKFPLELAVSGAYLDGRAVYTAILRDLT